MNVGLKLSGYSSRVKNGDLVIDDNLGVGTIWRQYT